MSPLETITSIIVTADIEGNYFKTVIIYIYIQWTQRGYEWMNEWMKIVEAQFNEIMQTIQEYEFRN